MILLNGKWQTEFTFLNPNLSRHTGLWQSENSFDYFPWYLYRAWSSSIMTAPESTAHSDRSNILSDHDLFPVFFFFTQVWGSPRGNRKKIVQKVTRGEWCKHFEEHIEEECEERELMDRGRQFGLTGCMTNDNGDRRKVGHSRMNDRDGVIHWGDQ